MIAEVERIKAEIKAYAIESAAALEEYKRRYTGRKGAVPALFEGLKTASPAERAALGKALNELKTLAQARYDEAEARLASSLDAGARVADPTLPGDPGHVGNLHPLRLVQRRVLGILHRMGFENALGPEIEDDWHNFSGLNFQAGHPARDMQDTFFVRQGAEEKDNWVLRTHTTSVQLRELARRPPPVRVVMFGRVYRNEAISARAHCFFHQIDGFAVDRGLSFADMKQTLLHFVRQLFGEDVQIRLRASYFPFTEMSAEMDISCRICHGSGCGVCKHTGWVEILGAGMVHPNVLTNAGVDASEFSGYAWGMGLERVAQLLFRVPDLRLYSQNDLRFLQQFRQFIA